MKQAKTSLPQIPGTDWRVLGELELPSGEDIDSPLRAWLVEILGPLHLHPDFLNKVLRSAESAAARLLQAEGPVQPEHIHLLILAPANHAVEGGTWGFFRIEKLENAVEGSDNPDHAIEFYLYVEGSTQNQR